MPDDPTTPLRTREQRLEAALRRMSVAVDTAQYEDDLYTTPKQSRDSLCAALRHEIKEALARG